MLSIRRATNSSPHRSIRQSKYCSFRKTVLGNLSLQFIPQLRNYSHATESGTSLPIMRCQIEPNPRTGIVFRVPFSLTDISKYSVIFKTVPSQVFFNGRKNWIDYAFCRQYQCLKASRHSPIAIRIRVNHHQIQMSHSSFYEEMI